ncbi:E3 ubiquitin-protein ligase RNF217-like [Rhopilema esculentum]|uniref:E3 ubiquitin-protein ligase RNF217-like n=1 Tax=Rhopilema esculentum TaxID=499914 RepID=UPI0031E065A0|eukprot:gene8847-16458_t
MTDYGLMKRASSLPHQRRKQKIFKRSLSLSLPENTGPVLKFSQAQHFAPESPIALPKDFHGAEQSSHNTETSMTSRIIDNNCQQHDEASVSAKDAVPCGTDDGSEEFDQDTCTECPSACLPENETTHEATLPQETSALDNDKVATAHDILISCYGVNAENLSHDITHPDQRSFPTPPTPPPPPPIKEWQPNPLSANPVHSSIMVDLDKLSGISDYDDMFSRLSVESGVEGWYCSICYCMASRNKESSVYCDSCSGLFCLDCMHIHLRTRITGGFIILKCPGDSCTRTITDEEIDLHCSEWMHIFVKNRVDADNNPRVKTCPGCNIVQHFEEPDEVPIHHKCGSCGLRWCIPCHAPWHNALTCKEFQKDVIGKGHKALKVWAKGRGKSNANAVKCPQCKFFIERISGCDHMCCSRCYTDFCYRCGKKHRKGGIFGDHDSRYSFFGCKYNLAPKKPVVRVAVRSGVLAGTIVAVPVVAAFVVSVGCIILAVSPVAVPSFIAVKKCRK